MDHACAVFCWRIGDGVTGSATFQIRDLDTLRPVREGTDETEKSQGIHITTSFTRIRPTC